MSATGYKGFLWKKKAPKSPYFEDFFEFSIFRQWVPAGHQNIGGYKKTPKVLYFPFWLVAKFG
jgi:hypothetical protein